MNIRCLLRICVKITSRFPGGWGEVRAARVGSVSHLGRWTRPLDRTQPQKTNVRDYHCFRSPQPPSCGDVPRPLPRSALCGNVVSNPFLISPETGGPYFWEGEAPAEPQSDGRCPTKATGSRGSAPAGGRVSTTVAELSRRGSAGASPSLETPISTSPVSEQSLSDEQRFVGRSRPARTHPPLAHPPLVRRLRLAFWVALAALVTSGAAANRADAQSGASSIREFVASKDKWPQLVGRPLKLEGRYTVLSKTELRFAGCSLRFLLPKRFLKPRGKSRNLEVSGQLRKQAGQLVFVVRKVSPRPSDKDELDRRRVTIDTSQPDELYELGQWARDRGTFYDDQQLLRAANRLLENGLARAFELLDADDAGGMRSLAAKAAEFGLSGRLQREYLHEANRAAFETERKRKQPDFSTVQNSIRRELPGSGTPLPPEQQSLRKDYLEAPRAIYRVADDATRRMLDRIFFGEAVLAEIERDAADDGHNGYQIAARIDQRLPERHDLAEAFRERKLAYLDGRIAQLTRGQLLELVGKYVEREQPQKAEDAKRRWLKARVRLAQATGPRELMELGEEYLNLLNDEPGAARMFQRAYDANPQLTTASAWLSEHGYELQEGRWDLPGAGRKRKRDDLSEAIHEGLVLKGMTGSQVRAALGGAPSTVVRMATAGRISEIWLYEELRISVQLTRSSSQRSLNVRRVTDAP